MTKNYDALRLGGAEGSALLAAAVEGVVADERREQVRALLRVEPATFANPVAKGCGDGGHGARPGGRYVEVGEDHLRDNGDGATTRSATFAHFDTMFDYDAPVAVRFVETPHAGVNDENRDMLTEAIEGVHNLYMP